MAGRGRIPGQQRYAFAHAKEPEYAAGGPSAHQNVTHAEGTPMFNDVSVISRRIEEPGKQRGEADRKASEIAPEAGRVVRFNADLAVRTMENAHELGLPIVAHCRKAA